MIMAGFCPPEHVVAEIRLAVTAAEHAAAQPPPEPAPRRRWFGRSAAAGDNLTLAPPTLVTSWANPIIPVVRFGNLTSADAARVATALAQAAQEWTSAEVQVTALGLGGARSNAVRGRLGGGTDALVTVARSVAVTAAALDLYLDRRLFQAELDVASIDTEADAEQLDAFDRQLGQFAGSQPWTVGHLSLMRQTFGVGTSALAEAERIPLGLG